ncbi:MAG: alpha/beta hydrolase fold domain-containing protein [Armatimonadetes bacterium]|nr:alpha/beta hydrolase fold domain-containing protein [Armatimonadota bacterium]
MIATLLSLMALGPDVKMGLEYGQADGKPLLMDFYMPDKPVRKPVPVVVMIHGGTWMSGSRGDMTPFAMVLAEKGVAVANVDYRLAPKSKWPAMIVDCQNAVRYLHGSGSELGIDPARIGAAGASAGAHLALLLGFTDGWGPGSGPSTRVQAVANFFGPTDLSKDFDKQLADFVGLQVMGKKASEAPEDVKSFSPVNHVDQKSAPVYTVHGTADQVVPVVQADRLETAMKAAGRPHTKVIVEGMGHGVGAKDEATVAKIKAEVDRAMAWLVARLKA